MDFFPLVLALRSRRALIAGGDEGAASARLRRVCAGVDSAPFAGPGRLARVVSGFGDIVKASNVRPAAWRRLAEGVLREAVAAGAPAGIETSVRERMLSPVSGPGERTRGEGRVYIVGAGPGDPDLLTVKALRAMQAADVVVYDRLIGDEILDFVRRDAERIYVGKAPADHAMSQDGINALLVAHARAGRIVVRLKGGDPFIFGRGGEEMAYLQVAGVAVEVVPGITAAAGCAAAAGLPLTHRDFAAGVTFVTGHGKAGNAPDLDWASLAASRQTIVVYMGVATAGVIGARLVAHGMKPATPAAIVENGTRADQAVVRGTVGSLAETVRRGAITGPALLVIGRVAALVREYPVRNTATAPDDIVGAVAG